MSQSAQTREGGLALIRRAAADVLLDKGLLAATTRAVTDRAGVGRGLLNHYFRWPELRAAAWSDIFAAVADAQFPADMPPKAALDHYLATAFDPGARTYWRLWLEATELAGTDPIIAERLQKANVGLIGAMRDCLAAGVRAELWQLGDPAGAALRISALYDGLAGMLLAGTADLTEAEAERHLRAAVALETGPRR